MLPVSDDFVINDLLLFHINSFLVEISNKNTRIIRDIENNCDDLAKVKDWINYDALDSERNLYYFWEWHYAVAYKSREQRDLDRKLFNELKLNNLNHLWFPVFNCEFDHQWQYWLLNIYENLNWVTNDHLWKWVIFNPWKYLQSVLTIIWNIQSQQWKELKNTTWE